MVLAVAIVVVVIATRLSPADGAFKDIVFSKYFLYEQLRIYRSSPVSPGVGTTPSTLRLTNISSQNLPPYPGAELIKPPQQGPPEVKKIDLPQTAYNIFRQVCAGDNGTFEWGVLNGERVPRRVANGWLPSAAIPAGYLVPLCLCNGKPATRRVMKRLANHDDFVPLLDSGYSHQSTIVMETCETSAEKVYWPAACSRCNIKTTKSCIVAPGSSGNESSGVLCSCYHGFDSVSRCDSIANECSTRVTPNIEKTGRDLCQVHRTNNTCSTDGKSYMCTCYMPYFENMTLSNFPNCQGQRSYDQDAASCEHKFCGFGVCVPKRRMAAGAECRCQQGYSGANCTTVVANVTEWSQWSECFPACGNTGSQVRVRECRSADADARFCEGLRRHYRRCQPSRCFEGQNFPVFIYYLSDELPVNLYVWTVASFGAVFSLVYFTGLLLSMGANFQDWKLEAVNQGGKLAYAIDEVCGELLRADNDDEGAAEEFFRTSVFVPRRVVDDLTRTRRLAVQQVREQRQESDQEEDDAGEEAPVGDWEEGGEGEGLGEDESDEVLAAEDSEEDMRQEQPGQIDFAAAMLEKKKVKMEDEDKLLLGYRQDGEGYDEGNNEEEDNKEEETNAKAAGTGQAEGLAEVGVSGMEEQPMSSMAEDESEAARASSGPKRGEGN